MSCCVDVFNFLCSIESACYEPFSTVNELFYSTIWTAHWNCTQPKHKSKRVNWQEVITISVDLHSDGELVKMHCKFCFQMDFFLWYARKKKQQCSRESHLDTKNNKYRTKCGTNVVWNFTIVGNSIYSHRNLIRLPFFAFYAFFFEI